MSLNTNQRIDCLEQQSKIGLGVLWKENLLSSYQDTTLGFGSEFRPADQLQTMLGQHPNFDCFSDVISNGMEHHFTENISEDERTAELEAMIDRGNHQSAQEASDEVAKLLAKDVLDAPRNREREPHAVPLAIHATRHPAPHGRQ